MQEGLIESQEDSKEREFSDTDLLRQVDVFIAGEIERRISVALDGAFSRGEISREDSDARMRISEEVGQEAERDIRNKGKVRFMINNFHGYFPGGMYRPGISMFDATDPLPSEKYLTQELLCDVDESIRVLGVEAEAIIPDPYEGAAFVDKHPELVARIFLSILDLKDAEGKPKYELRDLWT